MTLRAVHAEIKQALVDAACPGASNPSIAFHCAECCFGSGFDASCAEELDALNALDAADRALDALAALRIENDENGGAA